MRLIVVVFVAVVVTNLHLSNANEDTYTYLANPDISALFAAGGFAAASTVRIGDR